MPAQTCLPETTPGDQVELKRLAHAVCHPDLEGPAAGLGTREAPVPRRNIVTHSGLVQGMPPARDAVREAGREPPGVLDGRHDREGSPVVGFLRQGGIGGHRGQTDLGGIGPGDLGGRPPRPPTDPGLHITRTRFLIS